MLKFGIKVLAGWLPLAFLATVMAGLVYAAVQQNYRQSANDPQIQLAQDMAGAFSQGQGATAADAANLPKVEVSESLSPFVTVFTNDNRVVFSTGLINGGESIPPKGVFDYTRTHIENRITWEPKSGVRIAAVMRYYKSGKGEGFVLAGRSLSEVEKRETQTLFLTGMAWIIALSGTFVIKLTEAIIGGGYIMPIWQMKQRWVRRVMPRDRFGNG
jgi:hypothetical protein